MYCTVSIRGNELFYFCNLLQKCTPIFQNGLYLMLLNTNKPKCVSLYFVKCPCCDCQDEYLIAKAAFEMQTISKAGQHLLVREYLQRHPTIFPETG